jgi:hypothetical protein
MHACVAGTCRNCGARGEPCCGTACDSNGLECQAGSCQCATNGGTGCSGDQICDRNGCGELYNCRRVFGMCGYCPSSCEEGGFHGVGGLSEDNCTNGPPPPPCNNCDSNGVPHRRVIDPWPGTGCAPPAPGYCFEPC